VGPEQDDGHPAAGKGASYVRLSALPHARDSFSPDRQCDMCREQASRDGVSLVEEYSDLDIPARRNVRRPGFEAAVKALIERRIETLFVAKLDRLTRQGMGEVGLLLDDLAQVGGRIVFVGDGLDTSQPGARQIIGLLAEQARAESDNIAWRVWLWREYNRREGQWRRPRPYGFIQTDDGKLEPHPEEASLIRRLINDFLGGASIRSLARRLNEEGIPPPRVVAYNEGAAQGRRLKEPTAKTWGAPSVRKILIGPVLAGLQTHRGHVVRDENGEPIPIGEGIITLSERAQILAEIERRTSRGRRATDASRIGGRTGSSRPANYLLTSLVRCGHCGGNMPGVRLEPKRKNEYRCNRQMNGHPCQGCHIGMPELDEEVVRRFTTKLAALGPGDPLLDLIAERWRSTTLPETAAERVTLETNRIDIDARIADLEEARYLRGEFSDAAGLSRYERMRAKLIESRSAVLSALDTLGPPPTLDFAALLETQLTSEARERTPSQRRRAILKLAVQRVYVWRGKRWMQPAEKRIRIVWIDAEETEALNLGPDTPRRRDGE
jgi:site-specific DNA recombinase